MSRADFSKFYICVWLLWRCRWDPRSEMATLLQFPGARTLSTSLFRWAAECSLDLVGFSIADLWLCDDIRNDHLLEIVTSRESLAIRLRRNERWIKMSVGSTGLFAIFSENARARVRHRSSSKKTTVSSTLSTTFAFDGEARERRRSIRVRRRKDAFRSDDSPLLEFVRSRFYTRGIENTEILFPFESNTSAPFERKLSSPRRTARPTTFGQFNRTIINVSEFCQPIRFFSPSSFSSKSFLPV